MAEPQTLVGDIGGTHARFALAGPDGRLSNVTTYNVGDFETADDAVEQFIRTLGASPKNLCLASAGKRQGDAVALTNAHWVLSESGLQKRFGFFASKLINDFEALAIGAAALELDQLEEVKAGALKPEAPRLCLGPGTGFGQALVLPGSEPHVIATEGGFRLLPVRTERDHALYHRLEKELGFPPILEEALSGRGLVHLLAAIKGKTQSIDPKDVTAAALAGPGDEREAVLWFFELLATAAADACLMTGAWGGVLIGGGVVPHLIDLLDRDTFGETFMRPCAMQEQLAQVPIHLITDGSAALRGAAMVAQKA